jgi:hypothetical protein
LVDGIGLDFDQVDTSLDALARHDPAWWATGKVFTYRAQQEPFVHIDSDVYLWKRLPERLESAAVLAQNPEFFVTGASYYEPEACEGVLAQVKGTWLPPEWLWYRASGLGQRGENCGIFGGNQLEFIHHYADQALSFLQRRENRRALRRLTRKANHMVLVEQYLLAACIEYRRRSTDSAYGGVRIEYLFESMDDAFFSTRAVELGYTHLIAGAKQNPQVAALLEQRVKGDWPELYERCLRFARRSRDAGARITTSMPRLPAL